MRRIGTGIALALLMSLAVAAAPVDRSVGTPDGPAVRGSSPSSVAGIRWQRLRAAETAGIRWKKGADPHRQACACDGAYRAALKPSPDVIRDAM
jgi:hypothetical protein